LLYTHVVLPPSCGEMEIYEYQMQLTSDGCMSFIQLGWLVAV
jgi:hypothetical protein